MIICWDNLEGLKYNLQKDRFYNKTVTYIYKESCLVCKQPFLTQIQSKGLCCSNSCSSKLKNTGRIRSEEAKERIRMARAKQSPPMLGCFHSEETKKRISKSIGGENNANFGKYGKNHHSYGRKASIRTKEKMSKAHEGRVVSLKTRQKISMAKKGRYCGNEASNWNGGTSQLPYCYIWTQDFKEEIKNRDGYICQNPFCSKQCNLLCVHHIDYNKQNCSTENLITLCVACNSKANFDRKWHSAFYKEIMRRNKKRRFYYG